MEFEFTDERRYKKGTPKNVIQMYELFEIQNSNICKNCKHLIKYKMNGKNYYECSKYLVDNSVKLSWRLKNISCRLFKERENKNEKE